MDALVSQKLQCEDLEVEFDVLPVVDPDVYKDPRELEIYRGVSSVEAQLAATQKKIDEINSEIDRLTNHADGVDYTVAVASGILCGLMDSFFVGELGLFENANDAAKERFRNTKGSVHNSVNRLIEKYAKARGYQGDGLKGAIAFLEKKFPVAQDNVWHGKGYSSTKTHHIDDIAHHPSILGLFSAILVYYFGLSTFINKDGKVTFDLTNAHFKEFIALIIICGTIKWLTNIAEQKVIPCFDDDVPKPIQILIQNLHKAPAVISILKVVDNWFGHMVSDMGGSKNTAGGGTGIPGLFISFLKELTLLPGIKNSKLPKFINALYQNTKDSPLTDKLDLRTELAVVKEQGTPVFINEVVVRTFFFVRRILVESNTASVISEIDWESVLPFGNRTIVRMMTIASGTFTAVDMADAAIHAAGKSGGTLPGFVAQMVLRINFVGVGRFAIAVGSDAKMGVQRSRARDERIALYSEMTALTNAKVFYKQAGMWIAAENTGETIEQACNAAEAAGAYYMEAMEDIDESLSKIETYLPAVKEKNPGLTDEMLDILKWG